MLAECDAAADKLLSARRVDIYGIYHSGIVAKDLSFQLMRLGIAANFVEDTLMCSVSASMLTKDDLVIAVTSSGRTKEIIDAAKKADIHDYIMSLENGYDTVIGERGVRLSGGQKQRLCIARVFLKNPPILILDEATSALDSITEIMIQKSLEELCRGRTTIVVAHRLSTIKNADKIAVIADGSVKEEGTHSKLIENKGIYAELYSQQYSENNI